jgi:hypothetical protein
VASFTGWSAVAATLADLPHRTKVQPMSSLYGGDKVRARTLALGTLTASNGFDSMHFEIIGALSDIETFASGAGIREVARLRRA